MAHRRLTPPPPPRDDPPPIEAVVWDQTSGKRATHLIIFKHGAVGRLYYVGAPTTATIRELCARTRAASADLFAWDDDEQGWTLMFRVV